MSNSDDEASYEENNREETQRGNNREETREFGDDATPLGNLLYLRDMLCLMYILM